VTGYDVKPDALTAYAQNIEGLNSAADAIGEYMHTYGCDKSGFTGLLTILHPAVDLVGSLFGETLKFGKERLSSLAAGMTDVAKTYEEHDKQVTKALQDILGQLDTVGAGGAGGADLGDGGMVGGGITGGVPGYNDRG
jgi:hypothetical protein